MSKSEMNNFWENNISSLAKKSKNVTKLEQAGIKTLIDLLYIQPLGVNTIPPVRSFNFIKTEKFFRGRAKILSVQSRPNFWAKGKGKVLLHNIVVIVKDSLSDSTLTLKWFNSYPTLVKKLQKDCNIEFIGQPTITGSLTQITNPEFKILDNFEQIDKDNTYKIQACYPTINGVPGKFIAKLIEKIPRSNWELLIDKLPKKLLIKNKVSPLKQCLLQLHGVNDSQHLPSEEIKKRFSYEELFNEQIKIFLRKQKNQMLQKSALTIPNNVQLNDLQNILPFTLTEDQQKAISDIISDFKSGHPMMRLIQGDVGCGKTAVATIAAIINLKLGGQVAIMCPTESLALQHYSDISSITSKLNFETQLLIGSTSIKEKKRIQAELLSGQIKLIIGTHALFQESIIFKNLVFAVIDEQHKFGVEQRYKLFNKGVGVHGLLMSATPIPRSLSLTTFGDMDISIIKQMPAIRKGHKTRIVTDQNYDKFLSFLNTRLTMKEQIYIVTPSIVDNPETEIVNLEQTYLLFTKYFPQHNIKFLHGQLKSEEKQNVLDKFIQGNINILVTTSVIEVGINIHNATIMAIFGPERFGLSSLHQLRGRIGRGQKPGFCFLVCDKNVSEIAMERLKIIEQTSDGFIIAEEDLRIRGEGDLFGTNQSGSSGHKFAELPEDNLLLESARDDFFNLLKDNDSELVTLIEQYKNDDSIYFTL